MLIHFQRSLQLAFNPTVTKCFLGTAPSLLFILIEFLPILLRSLPGILPVGIGCAGASRLFLIPQSSGTSQRDAEHEREDNTVLLYQASEVNIEHKAHAVSIATALTLALTELFLLNSLCLRVK